VNDTEEAAPGGHGRATDPIVDRVVEAASYDRTTRALEIRTEGGAVLRYGKVYALAATQGARLAQADWVADVLPQTLLSERATEVAAAEAPAGLRWLLGDAQDFERCPVREALGFTAGRWYRLFVGARTVEVLPAVGGVR